MYVYHIFFIHSSVNGHLHCFHVLAIVNSLVTVFYLRFHGEWGGGCKALEVLVTIRLNKREQVCLDEAGKPRYMEEKNDGL